MEALSKMSPNGATLADIAARTGLAPSTAHRLLATLIEGGYVTRGLDKHLYVLGHRIMGVATSVQQRTAHLRAIVRPHLEAIAQESGEMTVLVALDGINSVYIDQVVGPRFMGMMLGVGSAFPANTSASAKAILAFSDSKSAIDLIFKGRKLKKYTSRTIVDVTEFRTAVEQTRLRGFAIERDEVEDGISCIAAPIRSKNGNAIAAIGVPGPTARILGPNPERLGILVAKHTGRISESLGFQNRDVGSIR